MFTIEQIKAAHSKVKSGADFPNYIQDLIQLGVKKYDTIVHDGCMVYYDTSGFSATTEKKSAVITIAPTANKERFIEFLVMHQDGQTDYPTFCNHAGQCGIARWSVDIIAMTCTYFDSANTTILIEKITI